MDRYDRETKIQESLMCNTAKYYFQHVHARVSNSRNSVLLTLSDGRSDSVLIWENMKEIARFGGAAGSVYMDESEIVYSCQGKLVIYDYKEQRNETFGIDCSHFYVLDSSTFYYFNSLLQLRKFNRISMEDIFLMMRPSQSYEYPGLFVRKENGMVQMYIASSGIYIGNETNVVKYGTSGDVKIQVLNGAIFTISSKTLITTELKNGELTPDRKIYSAFYGPIEYPIPIDSNIIGIPQIDCFTETTDGLLLMTDTDRNIWTIRNKTISRYSAGENVKSMTEGFGNEIFFISGTDQNGYSINSWDRGNSLKKLNNPRQYQLLNNVHYSKLILKGPKGIFSTEDTLYISDTENNRVLKLNLTTGLSDLVAGGKPGTVCPTPPDSTNATEACLSKPQGIYVNSRREVFIADTDNHVIRKVYSNGTMETIAGNFKPKTSSLSLNFPQGLYYDEESSTLYISDTMNDRILTLSNERITPLSLDINMPIGICKIGNLLYSVDSRNRKIFKFNNGPKTLVAGNGELGPSGDSPISSNLAPFLMLTFLTCDNGFYFVDTMGGRVKELKNQMVYSLIPKTPLKYPHGISYSNGRLFVSDIGTSLISDVYGNFSFGQPKQILLEAYDSSPHSIIYVKEREEYYFIDRSKNTINLLKNGYISIVAGKGELSIQTQDVPPLESSLIVPSSLAYSNSYIYITENLGHMIKRFHVEKLDKMEVLAGNGESGYSNDGGLAKMALLSQPNFIGVTDNSIIYFYDSGNLRIRRINLNSGLITTLLENVDVKSMYLAKDNSIYISQFIDNRAIVKKLIPICDSKYELNNRLDMCLPVCFGVSGESACSLHGKCTSADHCECYNGWGDLNCNLPTCNGVFGEEACGGSQRGYCKEDNTCQCSMYFAGRNCSERVCFGKTSSSTKVCNGNGICSEFGKCVCASGFSGQECEISIGQLTAITVSITLFFILLIVAVLAIILFRIYRKQKKIINVDSVMTERLLSVHLDSELIHVQSDSNHMNSFVIPIEKLNLDKPIARLGSGASGTVLKINYNGMVVAVKVFDMNRDDMSEDEFLKEAMLLSKLRHPNILNFFGVSQSPTKRFIVMECLDKSLDKLIFEMQNQRIECSLREKLLMCENIAYGIAYLHNLIPNKIIHRDLKPANVLLDKNGICKIADFGLSRVMSLHALDNFTTNIGTFSYICPEMLSGKQIDSNMATAIDIYSFAIIVWQILFEAIDPYTHNNPGLLKKLGVDHKMNFESVFSMHKAICEEEVRPIIPFHSLNSCSNWCAIYMPNLHLDTEIQAIFDLSELIKQCWSTNPHSRPSIDEVVNRLNSIHQSIE